MRGGGDERGQHGCDAAVYVGCYWAPPHPHKKTHRFSIIRRVPIKGYDISFLITSRHCEQYDWRALVDIICNFALDAHAEFASLKLLLNTRNRTVVSDYKRALVLPQLVAQYYSCGVAGRSG